MVTDYDVVTVSSDVTDVLNKHLEQYGCSIDKSGMLMLDTVTADILVGVCKVLIDSNQAATTTSNMGFGRCWSDMGGGAYGERTAILRRLWPCEMIEQKQAFMRNCAVVYNRWRYDGVQPGKSWTWHKENFPNGHQSSSTERRLSNKQVKDIVIQALGRFLSSGDVDDLEALRAAYYALV